MALPFFTIKNPKTKTPSLHYLSLLYSINIYHFLLTLKYQHSLLPTMPMIMKKNDIHSFDT